MIAVFTFAMNLETQEATFAGNMEASVALQILQQIVIMEAVKGAEEAKKEAEEVKEATPE